MKKALFILTLLFAFANVSHAEPATQQFDFSSGLKSKKPMIVFVYAPWSSNTDTVNKNVAALKRTYGAKANILALNIADPEAKSYNDLLPIQPYLPNCTMFKDKAKISKFVPRTCALDYACVSKKVAAFVN